MGADSGGRCITHFLLGGASTDYFYQDSIKFATPQSALRARAELNHPGFPGTQKLERSATTEGSDDLVYRPTSIVFNASRSDLCCHDADRAFQVANLFLHKNLQKVRGDRLIP